MFSYAVRRLLGAIPTLFIIITLTFFMMRIAPGGPFDAQRRLPPEIEHNIKAAYNLDKPVYQQYFIYLGKLAHGDMGPSYKNKDFTVNELIADGLPVSAEIGVTSMLLALLLGTAFGSVAALRQNSAVDYGTMSVAMMGITIPTFVVGPILTLIFGVYGLTVFGYDVSLPVGGWNGGALRNLILPVLVLALPQIAVIARIMRGSMVEVLHSNYVRTARAKGLSNFAIVIRHALRAAVLPLVSYLGPAIAGVLTGSLVVEQLFGIPGIGRYFVQGALNRDYTLVMGVLVYYATAIIILNLIADLLYAVLDPRVRYAQ
ncbi:MAG: oligopeptide ABC transporter permease OppB [Alphaproteobacteria bacterium]|nr:oligopeptide ABC transporter permease OppB [Alphaproteobacteria bacterium]MBL6939352.1 oligopeptide ABC transporter permease OppB [Alphaproteobacteria bacterium]MBL7097167.1 oligopeptide ABC transporter permease OppB [Alphaproteobacteria bacterium]